MGDVFDAMNRSRRERGEDPKDGPPKATPQPEDPRPEEPALPIDEVEPAMAMPQEEDRLTMSDEPATAPASTKRRKTAVADAAAKSEAETETRRQQLADDEHSIDTSLNGYSADVVVHHDRGSVITEQYRAIRTQVLARARNRRVQTHVITSSAPEEGKSVTTVNIGIAFSELRSQKTLLIEGDLRRPSFEKLFDRQCSAGLLQVLRGEVSDLDEAIHPTVYDNLQFMPSGGKDFAHSTELLSSPRMAQLLDRLKDRYDHIFIDTPPVITVTDACILGAMCDQTLLVVRLHKTPVEVVDRAKRLLRAANCEVAGVILTHMELEMSRYLYRYGYTYT